MRSAGDEQACVAEVPGRLGAEDAPFLRIGLADVFEPPRRPDRSRHLLILAAARVTRRRGPPRAPRARAPSSRRSASPRMRSEPIAPRARARSSRGPAARPRPGTGRERATPATRRPRPSDPKSLQRKATWASRYSRDAADQCDGRNGVQRVPDVREGGLHAERGEHDARDHREVDERVGVARELVLLLARRRAREPALCEPDGDVEVEPPERRGDRDAECRGERRRRRRRPLRSPRRSRRSTRRGR